MANFLNLGFEDPETSNIINSESGEAIFADSWSASTDDQNGYALMTLAVASVKFSGETYLDIIEKFGDTPSGWTGVDEFFLFAFNDPDIATASFNVFPSVQAFEAYEVQWGPLDGSNSDYATKVGAGFSANETFLFALSTTASASFDTATPQSVEDFEEEWGPVDGSNTDYATKVVAGMPSNETFFSDIGDITTATAVFDSAGTPENFEDFEELWDDNENYAFDISGISTSSAGFGASSPDAFEDFDRNLTAQANSASVNNFQDGNYNILINGQSHVYVAAGDTQEQIRDGLLDAMSASAEPFTAIAAGSIGITFASTELPVTYTIGASSPAAAIVITASDSANFWTQRGLMATI